MRPLLLPDVQAITPSGQPPRRDRAPDSLATGTPKLLREDLVALLGAAQVLTRPIDLVRFATDASPYRLFPKVVVIARHAGDVRKVLGYARLKHEIARFDAFMRDVVELVVDKYDGSLKAEHGTGRNIAPFMEREWGSKLTKLMWTLKRLADPENILSPGVMLTQDPASHLKNLQTAPTIEATVDRCIQCGYCEPVCPSRNLTTTPRQRIALRRETARQAEDSPMLAAILADYDYDAIQTCAGDRE